MIGHSTTFQRPVEKLWISPEKVLDNDSGEGLICDVQEIPAVQKGGRPPYGWEGGVCVLRQLAALPKGKARKIILRDGLTYNRVRYGLYGAAKLLKMKIHVSSGGHFVWVWRDADNPSAGIQP